MVAIGERVPDIELMTMGPEGVPVRVRTGEVLGAGRVVLFAVPGAFTPGCSRIHLPGFVQQAADLAARGVTLIACVSVNDAWVMQAWAESQSVEGSILMLADGSADFARAMGLDVDMSDRGYGVRSRRYSAILEDGVITSLEVESQPGVDVSSCERVVAKLG